MGNESILILGVLAIPLAALIFTKRFSRSREMTGRATVISHRMELAKVASRWSNNWNHLVTFHLSDGSELELYTTEAEYHTLEDGQIGLLTWEKDLFYHFDPDIPQ